MWWVALVAAGLVVSVAAAVRYAIVFPRQPLTSPRLPLDPEGHVLARRLKQHLENLASRPHNLAHYAELEHTATGIERSLHGFGFAPVAQIYDVGGRSVRNIEVEVLPQTVTGGTATIVVGAHYDSPDDSPGANDNGSGVAALLEIARALRGFTPAHTRIRLVFWVNEELPYGKTPDMGSWRHAQRLHLSGEPVRGVIALETLGYFSDEPGSQRFPWPFGLIYPDRGNFVAFVGLPGSRAFLRRALAAFRAQRCFPSIGGVAPGFLEGIDLSDHWAYRQFGMPALMVTDTAPFRNPYYHTTGDLPHTVDTESLARITRGLTAMIRDIA